MQHLGRDLDIAEDDHLADRGDGDPVGLLALDRDDQVLGAAADVGAWLLQVEHGLLVVQGDDAGERDPGGVASPTPKAVPAARARALSAGSG